MVYQDVKQMLAGQEAVEPVETDIVCPVCKQGSLLKRVNVVDAHATVVDDRCNPPHIKELRK